MPGLSMQNGLIFCHGTRRCAPWSKLPDLREPNGRSLQSFLQTYEPDPWSPELGLLTSWKNIAFFSLDMLFRASRYPLDRCRASTPLGQPAKDAPEPTHKRSTMHLSTVRSSRGLT